jgi:glucan phosphoethanolaminetransferase (alkaline phosphatase superfamily)
VAVAALLAYLMVEKDASWFATRFIVNFSQVLYFVGVVLTYLLSIAVLRLGETRARLVQLILALGISFAAVTAVYAPRNMFPTEAVRRLAQFVEPAAGTFLPISWAYTFTRVPEESRLETQAVAMGFHSTGISRQFTA